MGVKKWDVQAYQLAKGVGGAGIGAPITPQNPPAKKIMLKFGGQAACSYKDPFVENSPTKFTPVNSVQKLTMKSMVKQVQFEDDDEGEPEDEGEDDQEVKSDEEGEEEGEDEDEDAKRMRMRMETSRWRCRMGFQRRTHTSESIEGRSLRENSSS